MTPGLVLDLVLVGGVLLAVAAGLRQGLVVGALGLVGFVGGALLGAQVAPRVVEQTGAGPGTGLLALMAVVAGALVGQLLAVAVGARVRDAVRLPAARVVDAALGGLAGGLALLLVAWLVAGVLANGPSPAVAAAVRSSAVLATVDDLLPVDARVVVGRVRALVDDSPFPEVFAGLEPGRTPSVAPPDPAVADAPGAVAAREEVVRVRGEADCGGVQTGTGFLYAPGRVVTNAHVVAGVDRPVLETTTGQRLPAVPVVYDPARDLAVLAVERLTGDPLPLDLAPPAQGVDAVVLGYPGGGDLVTLPARVRSTLDARGLDIYGAGEVVREVVALRADVRPGVSGAPVLDGDGEVVGVVFAAGTTESETGFAVTTAEALPVLEAGRTAAGAVDTGPCAR